jgi:3-oxo-5-alpha-steroid 4-dehydrogenase 1
MSPIHLFPWLVAIGFQVLNGVCLGSWLGAYGPVTDAQWAVQSSIPQFALGVAVFYIGLASNFFHDEELREIRRRELKRRETEQREKESKGEGKATVDKHYEIPQAGLFKYMLFPHYFSEWVEWTGFWMAAGWGCVPARTFLLNEFFAMFPRAVRGKWWYTEKFGEKDIKKKWAVIPGVW